MNLRLILTVLGCCLIVIGLVLLSQAQVKMGPLVGMRLPLWDSLNRRYWTAETRLDWQNSFGLQANADLTHTLYVKLPPEPLLYSFGPGFITAQPAGLNTVQVQLDTAIVLNQQNPGDPPPVEGSDCYAAGSAAVRITQAGLFLCAGPEPRRTDTTGWQWKKVAWQTGLPPVVGSACGTGAVWSQKAGMFLCSTTDTAKLLWTLVPMQ